MTERDRSWDAQFVPKSKPKRQGPASSYMNPAYQTAANQKNFQTYGNAGASVLGPGSNDPMNDVSWTSLLDSMFGPGGAAGSGGGGGGGGGSGAAARPGDPDPLGWNAIAQGQNVDSAYAKMLAALQAQQAATLGAYDTQKAGLEGANAASIERARGLFENLSNQRNQTRAAAAAAFEGGQRNMQALRDQYAAMAAGRQPGMQATVQAFGGDPGAVAPQGANVTDMLFAQQANLAGVAAADDAMYANRDNVYGGLNADVSTQRSQMFDQLMAKLLADRQIAESQGASAQAKLAFEQQQQLLALQQAEQARRAQYV